MESIQAYTETGNFGGLGEQCLIMESDGVAARNRGGGTVNPCGCEVVRVSDRKSLVIMNYDTKTWINFFFNKIKSNCGIICSAE